MTEGGLRHLIAAFAIGDALILLSWAAIHIRKWMKDRTQRPDLKDGVFLLALGLCGFGGFFSHEALAKLEARKHGSRWLTDSQLETVRHVLLADGGSFPGSQVRLFVDSDNTENDFIEESFFGDQLVSLLSAIQWSEPHLETEAGLGFVRSTGLVMVTGTPTPFAAKRLADAFTQAEIDWQWQPHPFPDQPLEEVRIILGVRPQLPDYL
jgi:hypothetical protein